MRKLLVVLSVLFAVALVAGPVFGQAMFDPEQRNAKLAEVKASPLKASGEFTFGMLTPFDSDYAGIGYSNAYVDFTWYPDEYNSLLLELAFSKEFSDNKSISGDPGFSFPYFELSTDVGKALDLPVGLMNTIGLTSLYSNKYEVSGHAWERTKVRSSIDPLAWKIKTDLGKAQITAAIGFGERTNDGSVPWAGAEDIAGTNTKGAYNDFGVYAFMPEIGPVQAEAWYLSKNNPDFKGKLGFSVKTNKAFIKEMVTFAGGFMYDLVDDSVQNVAWDGYKTGGDLDGTENYWAWGAGAKLNLMGAGIGVSMNGDVMDAFDQLAVDVDYKIKEGPFGVQATAAFTFADVPTSMYLGSEFGVYAKVGAAKWTIGYLLDGDDEDNFGYVYSVAKINGQSKGGLFVVGDIDF